MPFVPFSGPRMAADCPGEWEYSSGPGGHAAERDQTPSAHARRGDRGAVVLFAPQMTGRRVLVRVSEPPPPPEEPRGERFRV